MFQSFKVNNVAKIRFFLNIRKGVSSKKPIFARSSQKQRLIYENIFF